MVTQRRGQRAGNTTPSTAASETKAAAPVAVSSKPSLEEQLQRAEAAVQKARDATAQLHVWWRQHLFRLSLLVLLLCLHQTRKPSEECIKNIKAADQYSGFDALYYILNDSVVEIMGLAMMSSLTYFLYDDSKPANFTEPLYMLSSMVVPMQLATYFQQPQVGCAHLVEGAVPVDRAFPVSVIYHMIVTLSCFFMTCQMTARNKEIKSVATMRKTLAEAERNEAGTKKKVGKKK